jgi:membrane-bound lytic murein transglycosylase F
MSELPRFSWFFLLPAVLLLGACQRVPDPPDVSGELIVLTRTSTSTYYLNSDQQPVGFEYDLVSRFAGQKGWRLQMANAETLGDLVDRLKGGEAHLAAAGLAITPSRRNRMRFGPVYAHERELVICAAGRRKMRSVADLIGLRLEVVSGSSHLERLAELQRENVDLVWISVPAPSEEALLERVASGLADCAVADALSYEVARNYLPTLVVALDLGKRDIAWALPEWADEGLRQEIDRFFVEAERTGLLKQLRERYFGHVSRLDQADVMGVLQRRGQLLEPLKKHFFEAQIETGIDWRLLAALAYQESQWDRWAVSPTGVRGIMMLTGDTADRMGVKDRLDPRASILGGARYLVLLKNELPERIEEPDRTWMALAAYNQGMGHLEDARRLAQRLGKNPDRWGELKEVLPLIARAQYLPYLRYGFARGGEATLLAENVRIYYDILQRYEPAYVSSLGESL